MTEFNKQFIREVPKLQKGLVKIINLKNADSAMKFIKKALVDQNNRLIKLNQIYFLNTIQKIFELIFP